MRVYCFSLYFDFTQGVRAFSCVSTPPPCASLIKYHFRERDGRSRDATSSRSARKSKPFDLRRSRAADSAKNSKFANIRAFPPSRKQKSREALNAAYNLKEIQIEKKKGIITGEESGICRRDRMTNEFGNEEEARVTASSILSTL